MASIEFEENSAGQITTEGVYEAKCITLGNPSFICEEKEWNFKDVYRLHESQIKLLLRTSILYPK